MSTIFENIISTQPPPPAPDPIDVSKAKAASRMNGYLRNGLGTMVNVVNQFVKEFNSNADGLTPTQVASIVGTQGAALLSIQQKVVELAMLVGQQQGATQEQVVALFLPAKPGVTYAAGEDGSIVVNE